MRFKTKNLVAFHFTEVPETPGKFRCSKCGNHFKQDTSRGYRNLLTHLTSCRPDYKAVYEAFLASSPHTLDGMGFVSDMPTKVYNWLRYVVMTNQPMSCVEDPVVRALARFDTICVDTLVKYFTLVSERVAAKIRDDMPEKFGVMSDGWSERSTHYVAVIAVYPIIADGKATRQERLLSLAPFEDPTSFTAAAHEAHLEYILSEFYGNSCRNVVFLSGDNCSTNGALAKLMGVPLVGCSSHRLNLAVAALLQKLESSLNRMNTLMGTLLSLKNAGRLRKVMLKAGKKPIVPIRRNKTRWLSTFHMVQRYLVLKPYIEKIPETSHMWLGHDELKVVLASLAMLRDFEATTTYLQGADINLADARVVFDKTLTKYHKLTKLKDHLGADAPIIVNKDFESGVVKIIRGLEDKLTEDEASALEPFLLPAAPETVVADTDVHEGPKTIVDEILSEKHSCKSSKYQDLSYIPATSNSAERLFSVCRYMLPDNRKSMAPETLERKLFLRANADLWDLALVKDIVNN
jgi:hypothetical protein